MRATHHLTPRSPLFSMASDFLYDQQLLAPFSTEIPHQSLSGCSRISSVVPPEPPDPPDSSYQLSISVSQPSNRDLNIVLSAPPTTVSNIQTRTTSNLPLFVFSRVRRVFPSPTKLSSTISNLCCFLRMAKNTLKLHLKSSTIYLLNLPDLFESSTHLDGLMLLVQANCPPPKPPDPPPDPPPSKASEASPSLAHRRRTLTVTINTNPPEQLPIHLPSSSQATIGLRLLHHLRPPASASRNGNRRTSGLASASPKNSHGYHTTDILTRSRFFSALNCLCFTFKNSRLSTTMLGFIYCHQLSLSSPSAGSCYATETWHIAVATHVFTSSAFMVATLVFKTAFDAALFRDIQDLKVLSDSHSLVTLLNMNGDCNELKSVLFDICCLIETFSFIAMVYVPRLANVISYNLEKLAMYSLHSDA